MATISLKVSDEERKRWQEAAGGKSLSAWIKASCNECCEPKTQTPAESPKVKPAEEKKSYRKGPVSALEAFKHMLPPD